MTKSKEGNYDLAETIPAQALKKMNFLTGSLEARNLIAYFSVGGKDYAFHYDDNGFLSITEHNGRVDEQGRPSL